MFGDLVEQRRSNIGTVDDLGYHIALHRGAETRGGVAYLSYGVFTNPTRGAGDAECADAR